MKKNDGRKKMKKDNDEICAVVLRKLSSPISRVLINHTNVTPNQVSVFSFLLVIVACAFFIKGGYVYQVIGAIFAILYAIMDHVDGSIARVKNLCSKMGAWLDGTIGFVSIPMLMLSLAYGMGTQVGWMLCGLAIISYPMQYSMMRYYKLDILKMDEPIRVSSSGRFESVRRLYGSMVFFVLLFISVIANQPIFVFWFFATIGNFVWIFSAYLQYKNIRIYEKCSKHNSE